MGEAVDWAALMRVGLGELRLSPDAFWAMTPLEFAAATGSGAPGGGPMSRSRLDALRAAYPDNPGGVAEGGTGDG